MMSQAGRSSARILIAEDNEAMRRTLCDLLEDEGLEVIGEAVDGVDAVAQAQALQPDVVLMDMRMPRLNGLAATQALKQVAPEVRILILSAYADTGLAEEARSAGADGYVVKGSRYDVLLGQVLEACARATERHSVPATDQG